MPKQILPPFRIIKCFEYFSVVHIPIEMSDTLKRVYIHVIQKKLEHLIIWNGGYISWELCNRSKLVVKYLKISACVQAIPWLCLYDYSSSILIIKLYNLLHELKREVDTE